MKKTAREVANCFSVILKTDYNYGCRYELYKSNQSYCDVVNEMLQSSQIFHFFGFLLYVMLLMMFVILDKHF